MGAVRLVAVGPGVAQRDDAIQPDSAPPQFDCRCPELPATTFIPSSRT